MPTSFDAPFRSSIMTVDPAWVDYNGHLNMAYYNVLFDTCVDELFEVLGVGLDYVRGEKASLFTVETHVCYLAELVAGDTVRATFQLLGFDDKRLHGFQELFNEKTGALSATSEHIHLHVDLETRRTKPLPAPARDAVAAMHLAHSSLPVSERVGRSIGLRRRPA